MAKGLKFNVYVGIVKPDGTFAVVTKIDNKNRMTYWGPGEGLKMTLSSAKDMVWYLSLNGFNAHVVQSLYELSNPETSEPEEVPND